MDREEKNYLRGTLQSGATNKRVRNAKTLGVVRPDSDCPNRGWAYRRRDIMVCGGERMEGCRPAKKFTPRTRSPGFPREGCPFAAGGMV